MRKGIFLFSVVFFLFLFGAGFALEANAQTETQNFFVEQSYDLHGRTNVEGLLIRATNQLYFYVEKNWWESRSSQEQNSARIALFDLGQEFQNHIYPVLTGTFGLEPKPGIDRDERITVLIHEMGEEAGGYFRTGDAYEKAISPGSNEREMLYLNSRHIAKSEAKSFLAHEFIHLITINQKDFLRRVTEEVWLNEARAEYAPTLLGYDDTYKGSNLERRVRDFLAKPSDSLTEWLNQKEDYGVVSLFTQYLVDHYGIKILVDSLQSSQAGIPSLNEALRNNGFQKDFSHIFGDWATAVLVNDCNLGEQYCYRNLNLQGLRVNPISYFIPRTETVLSTYHTALLWNSNWHRLVGGAQNFTLEFDGADSAAYKVPYVLCEISNTCSVSYVSLDEKQKGAIVFPQFDTRYSSLTIIPFAAGKTPGSNGSEQSFQFSWQVRVEKDSNPQGETELVSQLLARVAELQEQVRRLQAQLAAFESQQGPLVGGAFSCAHFDINLSFGMRSYHVRCLQEFLVAQGAGVYPEGLVTGNFLFATQQAVIRFQEKYSSEILAPFGLSSGTGYVGQMTRSKINQLISVI